MERQSNNKEGDSSPTAGAIEPTILPATAAATTTTARKTPNPSANRPTGGDTATSDNVKPEWNQTGEISGIADASVDADAANRGEGIKDAWYGRRELRSGQPVHDRTHNPEGTVAEEPNASLAHSATQSTNDIPATSPSTVHPGAIPVLGNRATSTSTLLSMTPSTVTTQVHPAPLVQATLVRTHSAVVLANEQSTVGGRNRRFRVPKTIHVAFGCMLLLVLAMGAIVIVVVLSDNTSQPERSTVRREQRPKHLLLLLLLRPHRLLPWLLHRPPCLFLCQMLHVEHFNQSFSECCSKPLF